MKKIISILLLTFLFPEKFIYSAGFKFINVGYATISSTMNGNNELIINTLVVSNEFLDRLYKVRDEIKLTVDPNNFSLKKIEKDVVEGKWARHYIAEVDSNLNVITKDKIIVISNKTYIFIIQLRKVRNQTLFHLK